MSETDLQKLIRMSQRPMSRADQEVMNIVNMRGLGPDDPIGWDEFSIATEVPQAPRPSPLFRLLGMIAPSAKAEGGQAPGNFDELLTRILGAGAENDVATWREREWRRGRFVGQRLKAME